MEKQSDGKTRRAFIKDTVKYGAALTALSSSRVLGANDRVRIGVMGVGGRARQHLANLVPSAPPAWPPWVPQFRTVKVPGAEVVAVADVYRRNLDRAAAIIGPGTAKFHDYRKLLDRKDIDAVLIAPPDHWHKHMLIDAVDAGKDAYVEKPVTHRLEQGPEEIQAVERTGRVVQTGTQQRSWTHYIQGKQIMDSGALGEVRLVESYWYLNYLPAKPEMLNPDFDLADLDWNAWLGSAPPQPFSKVKFAMWRYFWDFGGGSLTDLMTHAIETIQWYMDSPTPSSAIASGHVYDYPWECPDTLTCSLTYPKSFMVSYIGNHITGMDFGSIVFRGSKATLEVSRGGLAVYEQASNLFPAYSPGCQRWRPKPKLFVESDHEGTSDNLRNWLDCIRTRKSPNANIRDGVQAARAAHIGNAALISGRKAIWNDVDQKIALV